MGLEGVESDRIERKGRVHLEKRPLDGIIELNPSDVHPGNSFFGLPEVLTEIWIDLQRLASPIEISPRRLGIDFADQKRERRSILRRLRAGVAAGPSGSGSGLHRQAPDPIYAWSLRDIPVLCARGNRCREKLDKQSLHARYCIVDGKAPIRSP